jgi:hypothetical protein
MSTTVLNTAAASLLIRKLRNTNVAVFGAVSVANIEGFCGALHASLSLGLNQDNYKMKSTRLHMGR